MSTSLYFIRNSCPSQPGGALWINAPTSWAAFQGFSPVYSTTGSTGGNIFCWRISSRVDRPR